MVRSPYFAHTTNRCYVTSPPSCQNRFQNDFGARQLPSKNDFATLPGNENCFSGARRSRNALFAREQQTFFHSAKKVARPCVCKGFIGDSRDYTFSLTLVIVTRNCPAIKDKSCQISVLTYFRCQTEGMAMTKIVSLDEGPPVEDHHFGFPGELDSWIVTVSGAPLKMIGTLRDFACFARNGDLIQDANDIEGTSDQKAGAWLGIRSVDSHVHRATKTSPRSVEVTFTCQETATEFSDFVNQLKGD